MDAKSLVEAARREDGYYSDLLGLGSRAFPGLSLDAQVERAAEFVVRYEQIWHDVGNQDLLVQRAPFEGRQPLYLDAEHRQRNPNIPPSDYLLVLKEFMRRWAARKYEPSPQENWYRMQDEFASTIRQLFLADPSNCN